MRKLTGDTRLKAQSEIDQASTQPRDVVFEALVRPWQLIFMDPAIGYTAFYIALVSKADTRDWGAQPVSACDLKRP